MSNFFRAADGRIYDLATGAVVDQPRQSQDHVAIPATAGTSDLAASAMQFDPF